MKRSLRQAVVGFLAVMVSGIGLLVSTAGAATTARCGITWGSIDKQSGQGPGFPPAPLVAMRAGENACYDRLVFELDGPAAGYRVRYGPVVTEGQGRPLSIRGGASLDIVLFAPTHDLNGVPTSNPADPANIVKVNGFRTFRQVADGGSFEGSTTIGLGVRARLPFRISVLSGPGHHSRVVVDVAHRW